MPILQSWPQAILRPDPPVYNVVDNFSGSEALAAHVPDLCRTAPGVAYNVARGVFNTLSGGYARYTSGTHGVAIVNAGVANAEVVCRFACPSAAAKQYGFVYRSNADATNRQIVAIYPTAINYISYSGIGTEGGGGGLTYNGTIITDVKPLTSGTYYTFRLLVFGTQLRLFVNDVLYGYNQSTTYNTNTWFGIGGYQSPAAEASWDYLTVRPIATATLRKLAIIGDSLSNDVTEWPTIAAARYCGGLGYVANNHAAAGATIASHMDGQVTAAATDDADILCILLGVNDGPAYNPTVEYQENLIEVAGTNKRARVFALGILNTTMMTAGERDTFNGRISDAVTGARAAGANVTYWNTDGWIDPATDTADGLHPNAAGHVKIATQVLARLP